eukprot:c29289_g4_i1 orf=565-2370(+)
MAAFSDVECQSVDQMVDLKGHPVNKALTGRWKACCFLVGYEACERLAYYGIASNLVVYLTSELHEGTVASSTNVSNWGGTIWITPVIGAFIADTYLGRFWTFSIFSGVYIVGMVCLTIAVSLPALKPPPCTSPTVCPSATTTQVGFVYFALYLLSLGTGGTKPNISSFGADQFDDKDPDEGVQKLSFFNWWMFSICFGSLVAQTALVYIQDNVGWAWGYGIPTASLVVSATIFLVGTPYYRHRRRSGSPLLQIVQVMVAAIRNYKECLPDDESLLFEVSFKETCIHDPQTRLPRTSKFRFLDKAAVVGKANENSEKLAALGPWRLCTVTQVEQTKLVVGMMRIWLGTLLFTSVAGNSLTFFIKQGTTLNRHIGANFEIPAASLGAFITLSMLILVPVYDKFFVPFMRRVTGLNRGITLLQRMGIGMLLQIFAMVVAALVEVKRLQIARDHGLLDKPQIPIPMTIFWLTPQYILMGISNTFSEIATLEFFYDQAPLNMKSIGTAIYTTNIGVGLFCSSLLITIVHKVTSHNGRKSWLVDNLNRCRLDYFYWLLTILITINLGVFIFLAKTYHYKSQDATTATVSQGNESCVELQVTKNLSSH